MPKVIEVSTFKCRNEKLAKHDMPYIVAFTPAISLLRPVHYLCKIYSAFSLIFVHELLCDV